MQLRAIAQLPKSAKLTHIMRYLCSGYKSLVIAETHDTVALNRPADHVTKAIMHERLFVWMAYEMHIITRYKFSGDTSHDNARGWAREIKWHSPW